MCQQCYVPLHVHSYYSLLDGLPSPKKIAERAKDLGSPAIAITDHGNIFGMIDHMKACKEVGIKPICGIELYTCLGDPTVKTTANRGRNHLTLLAKNPDGIKTLMALVSETNRPDYFYYKPRIDLANLAQFAKDGNLLCLSGCIAGELSSALFVDTTKITDQYGKEKEVSGMAAACMHGDRMKSAKAVKQLLKENWRDVAAEIIEKYQQIFGHDNYYLELQNEGMVAQAVVVECLRQVAKAMDIPSVATLDAHYTCQQDFEDHKLLLCSQMHTTLEEQERIKDMGGDTMAFFYLDQFHIFDHAEMKQHYTTEEIEASLEIADKITTTSLARKPCLPKFKDNRMEEMGIDSSEYLKILCIEGAKDKLAGLSSEQKVEYWHRLQHELRVIQEAGLADYFLIVWDVCKFVDNCGDSQARAPRSCRGSGAGSLTNYVLDISSIDPIEFGLFFERFYNMSRNIPKHFDVGTYPFMEWLANQFDQLYRRDVQKDRAKIVQIAATGGKQGRIKYPGLLKAEAEWIDRNSPKMWLYLLDMHGKEPEETNPSNSHIAFAIGATNREPEEKPAATHDGHISLPDIDIDIGVSFRTKIISYLKERWGDAYVAQMITFGRLQGKAAIKEVFRIQKKDAEHLMKVKAVKEGKDPNKDIHMTTFDVCNEITKHIPDEAAIADELQQARDEHDDPDYGILRWAIDNLEPVKEAYKWYKPLFDQAMRIEGTKKSQSKHAAGVVIADRPIQELVPLAYDAKDKGRVVGFEMSNAEMVGAVKFDFLGVAALDKLWFGQDLINGATNETTLDEDYVE